MAGTTVKTEAVVLRSIRYGEADRIITFITPDRGKVKGIAKGVRKQKSKLAGGIELFSVSDISFIPGRRDIDTEADWFEAERLARSLAAGIDAS